MLKFRLASNRSNGSKKPRPLFQQNQRLNPITRPAGHEVPQSNGGVPSMNIPASLRGPFNDDVFQVRVARRCRALLISLGRVVKQGIISEVVGTRSASTDSHVVGSRFEHRNVELRCFVQYRRWPELGAIVGQINFKASRF
jgi:hypothetical protein